MLREVAGETVRSGQAEGCCRIRKGNQNGGEYMYNRSRSSIVRKETRSAHERVGDGEHNIVLGKRSMKGSKDMIK